MSLQTPTRAPKRVIQRRDSRIVANTITTSPVNNTVHTSAEAETLIRTMVRGEIVYSGTTSSARCAFQMDVKPNNKPVVDTIDTAETLDAVVPLQQIFRDAFIAELSSDIGIKVPSRIEIDVKSQRKLKAGDTINFGMVSSSDTGQFDAYLVITQWFKLT